MAIPDFQTLMLPLLRLCADGMTHSLAESVDTLGDEFNVSMGERQVLLKSGQTRLYNCVAWTSTYLRKAGLLDALPGDRRPIARYQCLRIDCARAC